MSLLTLLSHSHSSTSSLLAYVTSSPGVVPPVRRSVRHAAFEGPLSPSLLDNPEARSYSGSVNGGGGGGGGDVESDSQGWAAYISSLDQFRKDLKQIHLLEEELSRVKRDREILVTRLIKTTKSRPTKSDLTAIASTYRTESTIASSRASIHSATSNGSTASKDGKRALKLADAQAELLGCEEHLRSLEVRIEHETNRVMAGGLEDRFRAMEAVGRMWVGQAKRGLADLGKVHGEQLLERATVGLETDTRVELPSDAYELDSNPSLAPSQSASQIAYDDSPHRGGVPFPKVPASFQGPGSITGSIAEEEEGSSDDECRGKKLVVHENRPGGAGPHTPPSPRNQNHSTAPNKPSPLGVPSINSRARPISSTLGGSGFAGGGDDSDSDSPNFRAGGRRAASDIGAMGYHPPTGRQPLRRTFSAEQNNRGADGSDVDDGKKKKKGFLASLSRLFKSPKKREGSTRSGRDSPAYGAGSLGSKGGAWQTRTDSNIKRTSSMYGAGSTRQRRGGGDGESSSDDEPGNFVSVSNSRDHNTWSVDQVGRPPSVNRGGSIKRSSTMPVASGLIPSKSTGMKRSSSQSTITGRATPTASRAGAQTPTGQKTPTASGGLSRSGTMKSTASVASGKSGATNKTATTVKSSGTLTKKKTRSNGSIARTAPLGNTSAVEGRNIMSLVDMKTPPPMPEVPKAPKSQVNPQMELATAPGSSLVLPSQFTSTSHAANTTPSVPNMEAEGTEKKTRSLSRANSMKQAVAPRKEDGSPPRAASPLPPSRMLSPPLKSALRPSSPAQPAAPTLSPPIELPHPMYSISAPPPVNLPRDEPIPVHIPAAAVKPQPTETTANANAKPAVVKRNSYQSTTDGGSIYESAMEEDDDVQGEEEEMNETSESEPEDEEAMGEYQVVDNERVKRLGINIGPPAVERVSSGNRHDEGYDEEEEHGDEYGDGEGSVTSTDTATRPPPIDTNRPPVPSVPADADGKVARRKSVRMAVPDSPAGDSPFHVQSSTSRPTDRASSPLPTSTAANTTSTNADATRDQSPEKHHERWTTRIGRMREDTSDESDGDEGYVAARKGLLRNSGKWESVKVDGEKKTKRKGTSSAGGGVKGKSGGGGGARSGSVKGRR